MVLLKRDRIVDDPWLRLENEAEVPGSGPVIVTYGRWRTDREALLERNGGLGIVLASDQSPDLIASDLHRFDVVCLDFPKFTDGRAYSYARMLRARYEYAGEIRAAGMVLRDQLLFMRRCGFDAFYIPDNAAVDDWTDAFSDFSQRYQPTVDRRPAVTQLRQNTGYVAPDPHRQSDLAGSWSY